MDALRRAGLVDGFRMILRETSEWDDERKHAACEDLLRRARATWEDMLVDELIETDPEPVRQAILCANTMCELRHLADTLWLPASVLWKAEAQHDPKALANLKAFSVDLIRRFGLELEEMRVARNRPRSTLLTGDAR